MPEDCTVSFTAFKKGQKNAYKTLDFSFAPSNIVLSTMTEAVFPSDWNLLETVEIAIVASTSTAVTTGLLIDNVKHCNNV